MRRQQFWSHKSLDQLREEQGVLRRDASELLGAAPDLWADDEDYKAFEKWLREKRARDRRAAQRSLDEALKTPA